MSSTNVALNAPPVSRPPWGETKNAGEVGLGRDRSRRRL